MGAPSPHAVALSIAGVRLEVSSPVPFKDRYDGPYEDFAHSKVGPATPTSAINLTISTDRPAANLSCAVFESGGPWNMQSDPEGYRFNLHREGCAVYHTVACSDSATTKVRLHVAQDVATEKQPTEPAEECFNPVRYPLDQLLLMNHLAVRGGVIVHAAGLMLGDKALAFPGPSGAGKSTISRLFMDAGLGSALLSDDRVVIRAADEGPVTVWGTPWPGEARVARNDRAPLAALLFLAKAEVNELRSLTAADAARRLMPVVTCPWYDPERLPGVLDTCSLIAQRTPCYELRFRADREATALVIGRSWDGSELGHGR